MTADAPSAAHAPADGPALRAARMHVVSPASPVVGTVVSNERCTAGRKAAGFVRHVAIDVSGTPLAGSFVSGQSFGVIPPGVDANAKPHKLRLYSIASPTSGEDGKGNVLSTTVKRTIDEHRETGRLFLGVCSNFLCDASPGDKVHLTGPNGKRFVLPERIDEHEYVFIATGTGIAPFRGMIRELIERGLRGRIALLMGSPYATDLLYHEEFSSLASSRATFSYLTALSRESQGSGEAPMYVHDRLNHKAARSLLEGDRTLVYVCGVAGMELGVVQTLGTILPPDIRERYLTLDTQAPSDPKGWTKPMLHRQVKPSRRVFLEVYE